MKYIMCATKATNEIALGLLTHPEYENLQGEKIWSIANMIRAYEEIAFEEGVRYGALKVGEGSYFHEIKTPEQADEMIKVLQDFKQKEEPMEKIKIEFGSDIRFDGEYNKTEFEKIKEQIGKILNQRLNSKDLY